MIAPFDGELTTNIAKVVTRRLKAGIGLDSHLTFLE